MKRVIFLFLLPFSALAQHIVHLSPRVYDEKAYTDMYKSVGALVKEVDFAAVNEVKRQLEKIYDIKLEDRGEAHITIITPPEFDGSTDPQGHGLHDAFTSDEIHKKYGEWSVFSFFDIVCVGERKSSDGRRVFYLVVDSLDLDALRGNLQKDYEKKMKDQGRPAVFKADRYWSHITIGFVGGDIHGVSKGDETCVDDLKIRYQ